MKGSCRSSRTSCKLHQKNLKANIPPSLYGLSIPQRVQVVAALIQPSPFLFFLSLLFSFTSFSCVVLVLSRAPHLFDSIIYCMRFVFYFAVWFYKSAGPLQQGYESDQITLPSVDELCQVVSSVDGVHGSRSPTLAPSGLC